jgi:hypothetical protein
MSSVEPTFLDSHRMETVAAITAMQAVAGAPAAAGADHVQFEPMFLSACGFDANAEETSARTAFAHILRLAYIVCNRIFLGEMVYEVVSQHAADFGENLRALYPDIVSAKLSCVVSETVEDMIQPLAGGWTSRDHPGYVPGAAARMDVGGITTAPGTGARFRSG